MRTARERADALAALTPLERDALPADVLAELTTGRPPSLGDMVAAQHAQLAQLADRPGTSATIVTAATLRNALVTDPGLTSPATSIDRPAPVTSPLLDVVNVVPIPVNAAITPITAAFTSAAAVTAEGTAAAEATLTYTSGDAVGADTVAHWIPITRQALRNNTGLAGDVDTFLSGGLVVKLENLLLTALTGASGVVAQAYDTSAATSIRTAMATASTLMRELGGGAVTAMVSPDDLAALDLAFPDRSEWPGRVIGIPGLPDGFAYVSRFKLSTQLFASPITVTAGTIDSYFVSGKTAILATVEALSHIAVPGAIVKADIAA